MFYRITLDCNVVNPQHIDAIKAGLKLLFQQAITVNPGQPHSERSFITVQRCYHDETPAEPCQVIEHVETAP